jgi:D-alanyl-D-alanine carboxypeptidase
MVDGAPIMKAMDSKAPRARTARWIALIAVATLIAGVMTTAAPAQTDDEFSFEVSRLSTRLKNRMSGKSWHEGCPVPLRQLRLIRVSHHGFDGERYIGKLVVNRDAVGAMRTAFRSMWRKNFKIRKMWLVDVYDGNDRRSMRADNTSAFNCRFVAGTTSWSQHAYGRAIDINPVENPYVGSDGSVSPKKGEPYVDRSQQKKGMIHADDSTVRAFQRAGWGWGGYWSSAKDYQHFSATGS